VFDRIYAAAADPWSVETSAYEREKYDTTLGALGDRRFGRGLEIGCSIGAQTIRLAERCDALLALDLAAEAVRRARERCAGLSHVEVRQARIPGDWPEGVWDLIVISEVLYFLSAVDVVEVARLARGSLTPGGTVLLVNWTGFTDTPTTGAEAAGLFVTEWGRPHEWTATEHENYRLDLFTGAA
jgi:SAM-dependent methyltransferase